MIVISITGGFLIANIIVQIKFIKEVRGNPRMVIKEDPTENICGIYQLLYELKTKAP